MGVAENAALLVRALTQGGPQTRKALAAQLGKDRGPAGKAIDLVNELNPPREGEDALYPAPIDAAQLPGHIAKELKSKPGPDPDLVMLGRPAKRAIGVEIGHRHLSVGIGDANGRLLGDPEYLEEEHEIDAEKPHLTFERIAKMVKKQMDASSTAPDEIRAVAVSVPAPVSRNGKTLSQQLLPAFKGVDLNGKARKALANAGCVPSEAEVWVENDVDVLARGESRYGKAFGIADFVVLKCSSGIGAAIVANDRLLRGREGGGAGEIGHCVVRPEELSEGTKAWVDVEDPHCRCGASGHLEAYAGGRSILARIAQLNESSPSSDLNAAIAAALADPAGNERLVIDEAAALLGLSINTLLHLFNPQLLLVAGSLSEMGEPLLSAIHDECRAQRLLFGDPEEVVQLATGADKDARRRIGVRGAVTTALRKTPPPFRYA